MDTSLITFTNTELGADLRVLDRDGNSWFVLRDVLAALGSSTRPADAKTSIEQALGKGVVIDYPLQTAGGPQQTTLVSENAAVFLVANSRTEQGQILSRWIYLEVIPSIRKTGKYEVNHPAQPAATQERAALDIVKSRLEVAELFQVPLHMAQVEAAKAALMHTGVDYAPLLSHAPAQNNIPPENVMLEPADLAARFNITWGTGTPNGAAVNELLRRHGYQEKVCGAWKPTEQGVPYSSQHQWTKGPKSGFNYKWSVPLVEYLLDLEASI